MQPEEAKEIADHQRHRFNELVDVFDQPQPPEVMERLREIVSSAGCGFGLRRGRKDVAAGSEQIPSGPHLPFRYCFAGLGFHQLGRHLHEWYVREYCR